MALKVTTLGPFLYDFLQNYKNFFDSFKSIKFLKIGTFGVFRTW